MSWDDSKTKQSLIEDGGEAVSNWTPGDWGVAVEHTDIAGTQAPPSAVDSFLPIYTPSTERAETVLSNAEKTVTQFKAIGNNEGWDKEGEAWLNAADTAGSFITSALVDKLNRIKTLWNTSEEITIKSLIDDVAPFAAPFTSGYEGESFGNKLADKCTNMLGFLLGVESPEGDWEGLAHVLGEDFLEQLLEDESLFDSVTELKTVQAIVSTIQALLDAWGTFQSILQFTEPLLPVLTVAGNLATAWVCGGATAATATAQLEAEVKVLGIKLLQETIKIFREVIYGIKITMPSLLVGSLEAFSFKSDFGDSLSTDQFDGMWENKLDEWYEDAVDSVLGEHDISRSDTAADRHRKYLKNSDQSIYDSKNAAFINDSQKWYEKVQNIVGLDYEAMGLTISDKHKYLNEFSKKAVKKLSKAAAEKARVPVIINDKILSAKSEEVQKFDVDKDGVLSEEEAAAAVKITLVDSKLPPEYMKESDIKNISSKLSQALTNK